MSADNGLGNMVALVTRGLRNDIASGRRAPGTRLTEANIAEEFGISRVPVREALRLLEGEGLVLTQSPRVRVVAEVSDSDAVDVFEVRSTVEALAAARAAEHITSAQSTILRALLTEGQERLFQGDIAALPELNARLHLAIAEASGSSMILGLVNQITPKMNRYYTAVVDQRVMSSWREHALIVEAIIAGDAAQARQRMRDHVAGTAGAYLQGSEQTAAHPQSAVRSDPTLTVGHIGGKHAVWRIRLNDASPTDRSGPLRGIRVAVKDLFAVGGHAVGAGNPTWLSKGHVEHTNAAAVDLLVEAGATLAGIAQCDELGFSIGGVNSHYGSPTNPSAPGHLAGGSSSGPAVAVASGEADIGLGTDTAGSIRVPASYCGLLGLRTTHGAVDVSGVVPLAPSFDTVGLLARDPATLLDATLALLPAADPDRATLPRRILVIPSLSSQLPDHVARPSRLAIEDIAAQTDATLDLLDVPHPTIERWYSAFRLVQHAEAWSAHENFILEHPGALAPDVEERFFAGRAIDKTQEARARETLEIAGDEIRGWLPRGTVLALPTTSGPSPRLDTPTEEFGFTRQTTLRLTFLASMAGLPALAMPLATVGRLPQGISIAGAPGEDLSLIKCAAVLMGNIDPAEGRSR